MDPDRLLSRNVRALLAAQRREQLGRSRGNRIVDAITDVAGSLRFVYVHVVLFAAWIVLNMRGPAGARFDPSFEILTMVVSLEAIFLATFVLITQNRMAATAERRSDLDLQIDLLAEHEITRVLALVREVAKRLGVPAAGDPELTPLMQDVAPERMLQQIERETGGSLPG